jgi:hypothetical protein
MCYSIAIWHAKKIDSTLPSGNEVPTGLCLKSTVAGIRSQQLESKEIAILDKITLDDDLARLKTSSRI